ncbi:unnamed protein product, partial [Discosporangium mesarthrocarpum]
MIIFGDADFLTSESLRNPRGRNLWAKFISLLRAGGHIYRQGLPAKCEAHKSEADIPTPQAFEELAPDGGCSRACGFRLACGHQCPRRCHPGDDRDHAKHSCKVVLTDFCPKGHATKRKCSNPPGTSCRVCMDELKAVEQQVNAERKREAQRQREREAAQARLDQARSIAAQERSAL